MAVVGPPTWQSGVWASTVWAAGVWSAAFKAAWAAGANQLVSYFGDGE